MGVFIAETILEWVSTVLVEDMVSTQLNPGGAAITPGIQTVTPGSMLAIYAGAKLIVDTGMSNEIVTVVSTTASTFTATFTKSHSTTAPVVGATFPAGQADGCPLFTQNEMCGYLAERHNDFLLQVRPIYAIDQFTVVVGQIIYDTPDDAVRVERISVDGMELWNATTTDLDWQESAWQSMTQKKARYWYQDKVGSDSFGIGPLPQVGGAGKLFYSQKSENTLPMELTDYLLVPDVMAYILKYGVLAIAFSKDGEQRDPKRADYCQRRYDFGVKLARRFMEGVRAEVDKGTAVGGMAQ